MEEYKKNLSQNLITLRKSKNLTQSDLAEKINYSDKTVSKWENGDAVPDLETLLKLSELYNVSLDTLVSGTQEEVEETATKKAPNAKRNKIIITLLGVSAVWIIATLAYFYINIFTGVHYWMSFIWALPAMFLVLEIFNTIWGKRALMFIAMSCLLWTALLSIYLQFYKVVPSSWLIFVLGAPLQVSIILWSQLKPNKNKVNKNN